MKMINVVLALVLGCCLALSAQARDKREYHEWIYEDGCKTCHDKGTKTYPSDDSCLTCHDVDELAESTAREGDELWQNPHNNLHYGKDLPCVECHGEHQKKKPICANCHTFKFDKHQY